MTQETSTFKKTSSHRLSQKEMRASLLLPIGITIGILFIAIVIAIVLPQYFTVGVTIGIGLILLIYLLWSMRKASWYLRLIALLMAIPALIGITIGLQVGSMVQPIIGLSITAVLLFIQRLFETPLSYRAAYRSFRVGNLDQALLLVNKSIIARPNFWESYQLRALIHLSEMRFGAAERDAKKALALKPDADAANNTLGQIYLAQNRFADAEAMYLQAFKRKPHFVLYLFYLGLSEFRQQKYAAAVESLTETTHGTLPDSAYDLQNYYYLVCALEGLGDSADAQLAEAEMRQFMDGLRPLQIRLAEQPAFPHLELLRADLADLEKRLRPHPETSLKSN